MVDVDAVILAVPALAAAKLLSVCSPELSAELAAIGYTSSITVGLGYDRDVRQSLPPGFGFLVPRSEGKRLLAAKAGKGLDGTLDGDTADKMIGHITKRLKARKQPCSSTLAS